MDLLGKLAVDLLRVLLLEVEGLGGYNLRLVGQEFLQLVGLVGFEVLVELGRIQLILGGERGERSEGGEAALGDGNQGLTEYYSAGWKHFLLLYSKEKKRKKRREHATATFLYPRRLFVGMTAFLSLPSEVRVTT